VTVRVLIASPLEAELVERLQTLDARLDVTYRGDLLGTPRYHADHYPPIERSPSQAAQWSDLLAQAEVLFDVDQPSAGPDFLARAPWVRWIQASSSGVGAWARRLGLVDAPVIVTNAAGIHAAPLAEFVIFSMLYFARRMPAVLADQRAHHWARFHVDLVRGKTLGIVGLGAVGTEIARLSRQLGLRVLGLRRSPAASALVDRLYRPDELPQLLAASDYVVLCVPSTEETQGLLGEAELAAMPAGAVLINIARGQVVDEAALIAALASGHLGGAALDVFAREPLPTESPLWDMPNVLVTPHSMSTAVGENALLTELFADNLRRYLAGEALRNVVDKRRGY
jgi:phosphoglycerate dehydrogenase-like enzyme